MTTQIKRAFHSISVRGAHDHIGHLGGLAGPPGHGLATGHQDYARIRAAYLYKQGRQQNAKMRANQKIKPSAFLHDEKWMYFCFCICHICLSLRN